MFCVRSPAQSLRLPFQNLLILSCDLSDPFRSFLAALNCFYSLFLSSRFVENLFKLFSELRWEYTIQTREMVKTIKWKVQFLIKISGRGKAWGHFIGKGKG